MKSLIFQSGLWQAYCILYPIGLMQVSKYITQADGAIHPIQIFDFCRPFWTIFVLESFLFEIKRRGRQPCFTSSNIDGTCMRFRSKQQGFTWLKATESNVGAILLELELGNLLYIYSYQGTSAQSAGKNTYLGSIHII